MKKTINLIFLVLNMIQLYITMLRESGFTLTANIREDIPLPAQAKLSVIHAWPHPQALSQLISVARRISGKRALYATLRT